MPMRLACCLLFAVQGTALMLPRAPFTGRASRVRMALPASVAELVPENVAADAAQMQQVEVLWTTIQKLYKNEETALQALRRNSQILLPIYATPTLMQDSYDGLITAMGNEADALEIMMQNPAVLTCGAAIANETPDEIRKFAKVREVLDQISPEAIGVGGAVIVGLIIYKIVVTKLSGVPIG